MEWPGSSSRDLAHGQSSFTDLRQPDFTPSSDLPTSPVKDEPPSPSTDPSNPPHNGDVLFVSDLTVADDVRAMPDAIMLDALLFHLAQASLEQAAAILPRLGRIPSKQQAPSTPYLQATTDYRRHIAFAVTSLRSVIALAEDPNHSQAIVRPDVELASRCLLAELLMRELDGALAEADRVLAKGVIAASRFQRHPDLRYRLCSLQIELMLIQGDDKLARSTIRRHIADLSTGLPNVANLSHWLCHFQLLHVDLLPCPTALAMRELLLLAKHRGDEELVMASRLILARAALLNGDTFESQRAVEELATALNMPMAPMPDLAPAVFEPRPLALQAAILYGFYQAHVAGQQDLARAMMKAIHGWLDSAGTEASDPWLRTSTGVFLYVPPPSNAYSATFLFSALVNRDPAGKSLRNCLLFHEAGLAHVEARWRDTGDGVHSIEAMTADKRHTMAVQIDLLLAKVDILLCRSRYADARDGLAEIVRLVDAHQLWAASGPRIVLVAGMLRQATGDLDRALSCYRVIGGLDTPLALLASASHLLLRIGQGAPIRRAHGKKRRLASHSPDQARRPFLQPSTSTSSLASVTDDDSIAHSDLDELASLATDLVSRCAAQPLPSLRLVGDLLDAVAVPLVAGVTGPARAKRHLSAALSYATTDPHARVLVLALLAAQYLHTATDQAARMATGAAATAKSLGAEKQGKGPDAVVEDRHLVGNPTIGAWLGEQLLAVYEQAGDQVKVAKQKAINEAHARVLEQRAVMRASMV